jgi:hypothetical protein
MPLQLNRRPLLRSRHDERPERALIHYPNRVQLWLRFYLEPAQLFRDRILQSKVSTHESGACIRYFHADIKAIRRIGNDREVWKRRATDVLKVLADASVGAHREGKVLAGPDGGEELAKLKGIAGRRG